MIEYVTGNLLEADAEAIVNTVNTVGVPRPRASKSCPDACSLGSQTG
jgi:hypothetical protein